MGKLDRVTLGLLAATLLGCSSRASSPEPSASTPAGRTQPAPASAATPDERFDGSGQLLPSEQRASWLELPRGFRAREGSSSRLWVYEAHDMPLAKVRTYLAARLGSERIEYPAGGVTFHAARPTYTQLTLPALEVRALEVNGRRDELRLWIEELPSESAPRLSVDVAAKELARMRSRLE